MGAQILAFARSRVSFHCAVCRDYLEGPASLPEHPTDDEIDEATRKFQRVRGCKVVTITKRNEEWTVCAECVKAFAHAEDP